MKNPPTNPEAPFAETVLNWKHITIISPFVLRVFLALCPMSNYGPYSPLSATGVMASDFSSNLIVGCDIAKHTDWTVLIAMDAKTGRCLEMERFNQLDWPLQKERIAGFVKRWNALLVMDATGVGDPVYDDLRRVLPRVEGFKITAQSKRELVQGLMVAVEQRGVAWPAGRSVGSGCGQYAVGMGINHRGTELGDVGEP